MSWRTQTGPRQQHKQQPNLQPSLAEIDEVRGGREATSVSHLAAQGKGNGDRQSDRKGGLEDFRGLETTGSKWY